MPNDSSVERTARFAAESSGQSASTCHSRQTSWWPRLMNRQTWKNFEWQSTPRPYSESKCSGCPSPLSLDYHGGETG